MKGLYMKVRTAFNILFIALFILILTHANTQKDVLLTLILTVFYLSLACVYALIKL